MNALFEKISQYTDILFAVSVIGMIAVMIIPMPAGLMDLMLTFNIACSLIILLMTLYITDPLELSVFPGLLLVMTLFRLSLNVASTRLILGEAYAGEVINSFGQFVVKGNYILGLVIFLIIVIIQFVVITKGAGRVAEVAARFTLDAMPGKQMSIDADLNAGLITEEQARSRRENISREADFYGAMDGASKFVRGDAVAGILITLVNILGGLAIGVLQLGMPAASAAQTYTILTIGDGLVSQIPALITSIAAGIIVTRSTSEDSLGKDLGRELTARPR
ncbi:MAG: flagellar biosynthesis protein FlhA, partial [bacterium]|nr:flagellar biosynthesis protein FlhA [bacterium]